jgi:hypothetical protein
MSWQDFILAKSGCYNDEFKSDDKHMPQELMNTNCRHFTIRHEDQFWLFLVKISSHGFQLSHIIKYGDKIMNETTSS